MTADDLNATYPGLFQCGLEIGDGWLPLVAGMAEKIKGCRVHVIQVKEKFGLLRVYIAPADDTDEDPLLDAAYAAVDEAEKKSAAVCEQCGQPGTLGGKGWIRTLCVSCRGGKNG